MLLNRRRLLCLFIIIIVALDLCSSTLVLKSKSHSNSNPNLDSKTKSSTSELNQLSVTILSKIREKTNLNNETTEQARIGGIDESEKRGNSGKERLLKEEKDRERCKKEDEDEDDENELSFVPTPDFYDDETIIKTIKPKHDGIQGSRVESLGTTNYPDEFTTNFIQLKIQTLLKKKSKKSSKSNKSNKSNVQSKVELGSELEASAGSKVESVKNLSNALVDSKSKSLIKSNSALKSKMRTKSLAQTDGKNFNLKGSIENKNLANNKVKSKIKGQSSNESN